jgi:hypothetical protein
MHPMPTPSAARDAALSAYSTRRRGGLAGVAHDTVLSALDRVIPSLRIRHVTFRLGSDELYLVTPASAYGSWAGLIIPGQGHAEVTMWHRGEPCAHAKCDGDGVAVFPALDSGPVRFVYRQVNSDLCDADVEVQTEWVLIP